MPSTRPALAAVVGLLGDLAPAVRAWHDRIVALTPAALWHGAQQRLRTDGRGLLSSPDLLVERPQALAHGLRAAERHLAGREASAPRVQVTSAWRNPEDLRRGDGPAPSRHWFNPFHLAG